MLRWILKSRAVFMQRHLCGAQTELVIKEVRERQWDMGHANRHPLCGRSCTLVRRLFFQAEPQDAFMLLWAAQCSGEESWKPGASIALSSR